MKHADSLHSPDIFLSVGDPSSDLYASWLVREIWRRCPHARVRGVGGPHLRDAGVELFADSSPWGRIGVVDALVTLPSGLWAYGKTQRILREERPSLFIAMDWGGVNVRLMAYVHRLGIPTLYYMPPRSWDRAACVSSTLVSGATKIATPFPWSEEILRQAGADAAFVGHPALDTVCPSRPRGEVRQSLNVPDDASLIALLPGSRPLEIKYTLPVLLQTAQRIQQRQRDVRFAVAQAHVVKDESIARHRRRAPVAGLRVLKNETYNLLHACDFAIVTSGTATLEAACLETPMAIVYPTPWYFYAQAAFVKKLPSLIGLPNIIAQEMIVPEIYGRRFNPSTLTEVTLQLLDKPEALTNMRQRLREVRQTLGSPGATARTADLVMELIEHERPATIVYHAT